jgi:hypothetical protein
VFSLKHVNIIRKKELIMKKLLAIFMALAMIFVIAACTSDETAPASSSSAPSNVTPAEDNNNETTNDSNDGNNENDTNEDTNGNANTEPVSSGGDFDIESLDLVRFMNNGKFSLDFTMSLDGETLNGMMAMDGRNVVMTMSGDMFGMDELGFEEMTVRVIIKDYMAYVIFDELEAYMGMSAEEMDLTELFDDFLVESWADANVIGGGNAEINGKMLDYIIYTYNDETGRIFIENGQVYALASATDVDEYAMIVSNVSDNVPASLFDVPTDYMDFMEMLMAMF